MCDLVSFVEGVEFVFSGFGDFVEKDVVPAVEFDDLEVVEGFGGDLHACVAFFGVELEVLGELFSEVVVDEHEGDHDEEAEKEGDAHVFEEEVVVHEDQEGNGEDVGAAAHEFEEFVAVVLDEVDDLARVYFDARAEFEELVVDEAVQLDGAFVPDVGQQLGAFALQNEVQQPNRKVCQPDSEVLRIQRRGVDELLHELAEVVDRKNVDCAVENCREENDENRIKIRFD